MKKNMIPIPIPSHLNNKDRGGKQKHKDKKRRLFLEQKELAALQKANEEAQKRGSKRDAEGEDPRITQAAVERRILKRVDDAKRRKRANLQEEAD